MKSIALILAAALVTACAPNQGALTGAAIGATAGATLADSDDQVEAAIAGGAIGAAVGNATTANAGARCRYTRPDGSTYVAACP